MELDTSIPIRVSIGIGFNPDIFGAAKARARSSDIGEAVDTFTPTGRLTSYLVTDGPISARYCYTLIPKRKGVASKILIFSLTIFFSLD